MTVPDALLMMWKVLRYWYVRNSTTVSPAHYTTLASLTSISRVRDRFSSRVGSMLNIYLPLLTTVGSVGSQLRLPVESFF
jgi:hypothetical protein